MLLIYMHVTWVGPYVLRQQFMEIIDKLLDQSSSVGKGLDPVGIIRLLNI